MSLCETSRGEVETTGCKSQTSATSLRLRLPDTCFYSVTSRHVLRWRYPYWPTLCWLSRRCSHAVLNESTITMKYPDWWHFQLSCGLCCAACRIPGSNILNYKTVTAITKTYHNLSCLFERLPCPPEICQSAIIWCPLHCKADGGAGRIETQGTEESAHLLLQAAVSILSMEEKARQALRF